MALAAETVGFYELSCSTHAPTMTASILSCCATGAVVGVQIMRGALMRLSLVPFVALVVLVSTLGTSGCASPPEAEKKAAEDAVSAAKAAGATTYASDELAAATEALRSADERMAAKEYADAKARYLKAKELGDHTTRAVDANRTAMKSAIEEQLGQLDRRWEDLAERVQAAANKLKKQQRQDWEADSKTAAENLQAAKNLASNDPAGAKEKLGALTAFMDKWEAELKAPSAPVKEAKPPMKR